MGEVEREVWLVLWERQWRDAMLYGDGSMPTWVKHRIDPLDPRWWPPGEPTYDCE